LQRCLDPREFLSGVPIVVRCANRDEVHTLELHHALRRLKLKEGPS
jgi:hypothetical protein